jgi:hypothetical protein
MRHDPELNQKMKLRDITTGSSGGGAGNEKASQGMPVIGMVSHAVPQMADQLDEQQRRRMIPINNCFTEPDSSEWMLDDRCRIFS